MLTEPLDQIVGPGHFPGGEQMRLGVLRLLQAHDRHQMHVNSGDGVGLRLHGESGFHDADALAVISLKVGVMGLYVQCKHPQSRRQKTNMLL